MGLTFSAIWDRLFGTKELRILMVGLDAAGKVRVIFVPSISACLNGGTLISKGFNVETVEYKNISFTVWDIGGQDKIRPLWRHYYNGTNAIIFVIDSNDRDRVDRAREELNKMLGDETLSEALILVFANKQDLPNAMSASELSDKLGMHSLRHRQWYMQSCCATTGDGLYEGLEWLAQADKGLSKRKR